jgi:hypothetical protein
VAVTLSESAKNLVRSNFFGKDFATYVTEINDFLVLEFGQEITSNIVASELGQMLIEMVAFALSTMSWYGDRQADDTNLTFVRLRSAAVTIARQLGYKPRAAVPPAIEITMTLSFPPTLTRLTIERGRRLVGPSGLTYVTTEEVIFDVGEVGPKTFGAVEGELVEEIFTSTGKPDQFFLIETIPTNKSISQDSPRVFVNASEWDENPLLTFEQTDQFEFGYGFNPPRLQFGDGIAGNVPPPDAEIRVTYLATAGPAGAVQANTVVAFQAPLVAGTQTLAGNLSHDEPSTPGSARETIASIRVNAPQVTQAQDRAVTQQDLDAFINSFIDPVFGAVAIGRATVPRSVEQDAEALTIIGLIQSSCPLSLGHGTVFDSDFAIGEIVTGQTSGATGVIVGIQTSVTGSFLSVSSLGTADYAVGETIIGGTSLAFTVLLSVATSEIVPRLSTYWNKVLASNCQANVVIAQILSADQVGRYIVAPVALARAVEEFLDERAESTVKVIVTDGSINLFAVDLAVRVEHLPIISGDIQRQALATEIVAALETALLGRAYGVSLRISDLYSIVDAIEGVDYSHVQVTKINGEDPAPGQLNEFGDLEILDFEVITLGLSPTVTFI